MTLQQIKDLFTELESLEITQLELRKGEKITNFKKFLDSHKAIIFSNNHIDIKRNYIERILLVKKLTANIHETQPHETTRQT
jgi:hypothetical protein